MNLNKEAELEYFSKYESNDNKTFWVNYKPYFTNKHSKADTDIMLSENGEFIPKNKEIANTFNDYFGSIFDHFHHSLSPTKFSVNSVRSFFFQPVFMDEIKTVIRDKSVGGENNKSVGGEKPVQILK